MVFHIPLEIAKDCSPARWLVCDDGDTTFHSTFMIPSRTVPTSIALTLPSALLFEFAKDGLPVLPASPRQESFTPTI